MAYWHCVECTATYSVDAPACPQCGSKKHVDDVELDEGAELVAAEQEKKARKS
jgi:uncharacterized OB-fold protein